jgi:hypothetical protein
VYPPPPFFRSFETIEGIESRVSKEEVIIFPISNKFSKAMNENE